MTNNTKDQRDQERDRDREITAEEIQDEAADIVNSETDPGDPLALPDPVQPEKHMGVVSENPDDDEAYSSHPKVDWMRREQKQIALRIEETIVINSIKKQSSQ